MMNLDDIPNSTIEHMIDEYVHNERNRKILKRKFIDGITFEKIAEEFDMSVRQIQKIVYKDGDRILLKIFS